MSIDPAADNRPATPEPPTGPVPTYDASAARVGRTWIVTIPGLPDGSTATTHGTTWREAKTNAGTRIRELLGPDVAFGVRLSPADPDADEAVQALVEARAALLHAEEAHRRALDHAARTLIAQGWTTRDAGHALHLSPQRISQLVPRKPA
ncbi:hypothetical protein ACFRCG_12440 [Embleya sp. NPDC056575]|uniref:hypothetical protein n=1 Tax=unclassified Embleya TaxID=2699296 RepID=UPI0036C7B84C